MVPGGPRRPARPLERARYIFAEGEGAGGEEPPNDWPSIFGGSAWDRVEDGTDDPRSKHLHLFDSTRPDYNWRNEEVRGNSSPILKFWFDRGVDGFRIDVAHGLVKAPEIPRGAGADGVDPVDPARALRGLRLLEAARRERPAEVLRRRGVVKDPEILARFTAPGELQRSSPSICWVQPWFAHRLRTSIERSFEVAGAEEGPAWALANRRLPARHAARTGCRSTGPRSFRHARRCASHDRGRPRPRDPSGARRRALMFALPGTVTRLPGRGARP